MWYRGIAVLSLLALVVAGLCKRGDDKRRGEETVVRVVAISETTDALPSSFLQKVVISSDPRRVEEQLLSLPCIERAHTMVSKDGMMVLRYRMREPEAIIYQSEGGVSLGCDATGNILNMSPFYSPKNLPSLIFSYDSSVYKDGEYQRREIVEAIAFLKRFQKILVEVTSYRPRILLIDFSKTGPSVCFFRRSIVVECTMTSTPQRTIHIFIRLHPSSMESVLGHMISLVKCGMRKMPSDQSGMILDMRYRDFCLIKYMH